jgi:hypothetical protein
MNLRQAGRRGMTLAGVAMALILASWAMTTEAHSRRETDPPPTPSHLFYLPLVSRAPDRPSSYRLHLPLVQNEVWPPANCPTESAQQWGQMTSRATLISGAAQSPDLNLNLRGWYRVNEPLRFTKYDYPGGEPPDNQYPLYLSHIVPGGNEASFVAAYQISDWDWLGCNCAVPRNPAPYPVTMLGLRAAPGQPVRIARRGLAVDPQNFIAMVMYADVTQLALVYLWEDRVDAGYLVHLLNFCVDPNLVRLYEQLDGAGRAALPGIRLDDVVGVAMRPEVDVVVRDSGSFMDPRSQQDWWQDQPAPISSGYSARKVVPSAGEESNVTWPRR